MTTIVFPGAPPDSPARLLRPRHSLVLLFLCLLPLSACDCGGDTQATVVGCERNQELIEERRACVVNDDCPCGTACTLGECVAACSSSSDCGSDESCDGFGQCRVSGDNGRTPLLAPESEGKLVASTPIVKLYDGTSARSIRLSAHGLDLGETRVLAEEGLEVSCDDGTSFALECRIPAIAIGTARRIQVRPLTALEPDAIRVVRVFTGTHRESISVVSAQSPLVAARSQPASPVAIGGALAGVYSGRAHLIRSGIGAEGSIVDQRQTIEITAEVHAAGDTGAAVLVLYDASENLGSGPEMIGALQIAGDGTGRIDFPTTLAHTGVVSGAGANADTVEVLLDHPIVDVVSRNGGSRTLSFTLINRMVGMLAAPSAPQSSWGISLYKTQELPTGPTPRVEADVTASLATNRSAAGFEGTMNLGLRNLVPGGHLDGPADAVYEALTADSTSLIACALDDADAPELRESLLLHTMADLSDLRTASFRSSRLDFKTINETNLSSFTSPFVRLLAPSFTEASVTPAFNVFLTTQVSTPTEIPCEYFGGTMSIDNPVDDPNCTDGDRSVTIVGPAVNACAQMEEEFGCTVTDVSTTFSPEGINELESDNFCTYGLRFSINVTKVCTFDADVPRPVARRCGELATCYDPSIAGAAEGFSTVLGASVVGAGDLACLTGPQSIALDIDTNATDIDRAAMRIACMDDLKRLETDASVLPFASVFQPGLCVDAARLLYSTGVAFESARFARVNGTSALRNEDDRVAIRLAQRWIQLHGFIAQESVQTEQLAEVIRTGTPGDPAVQVTLREALAASLHGWEMFLHPRFASGLAGLSPDALAKPDYRSTNADPLPGEEQGEGIAVAMLETLSSQANLASIAVERALATGNASALDIARDVFHYEKLVQPLIFDLFARAKTSTGPVFWEARYQAALLRHIAAMGRLGNLTIALKKGANPLGIEEQDLPLYFFSDQTGAGGKFSAISDFLLGTSPASTTNFAPFAIRQASESFDAARQAWILFQDRKTAVAQSGAQLSERLEEIHLRFAGELTSYCGTPGDLSTTEVLDGWEGAQGEPFSADTCYFKTDTASCKVNIGPWAELLNTEDILYQYCVADELKKRVGEDVVLRNESFAAVIANFSQCAGSAEFPVACTINGVSSDNCFQCRGGAVQFAPTPDNFINIYDAVAESVVEEARTTCSARFSSANTQLAGIGEIDLPALDDPNCYRGSLGEAALTVRAAATEVAIARSEYNEFQERYDIDIQSCLIAQLGNDKIEGAIRSHNKTMTRLRNGKIMMDGIAHVAAGVKDCSSTAAGTTTPAQSGATVTSCVAAGAEAAAKIGSDLLQGEMDEAQQNHDALITSIENDIQEQQCFNDAEMQLVGVRTQTLRIERAISELQIEHFRMTELKVLAKTAYDDGLASLAAARERSVSPLAHDYWLDERLTTFKRRFRIAKRVSFLAARAVEYEFQQSLNAGGAILAAHTPDQLETALEEIWNTAGTRRINGNAPSDLKIVVSLKKGLLQLADNSGQSAGESQLSSTDRFRLLLQDRKYGVYAEDGTYLGQQVPFTIAPLEQLGLGNTQGISIFARNSCAERIWSVNATIHGEAAAIFVGDTPSFVDVQLLKTNTFYSQWCSPENQETSFQQASVRPGRNLFADPGAGALVGDELGLQNGQSLYSRARMQAVFNVDRDRFSEDDFANGDTSELAARGLYGEYALFFPSGTLSTLQPNHSQSDGLDLNAVEDILLRIDYVSVAR